MYFQGRGRTTKSYIQPSDMTCSFTSSRPSYICNESRKTSQYLTNTTRAQNVALSITKELHFRKYVCQQTQNQLSQCHLATFLNKQERQTHKSPCYVTSIGCLYMQNCKQNIITNPRMIICSKATTLESKGLVSLQKF